MATKAKPARKTVPKRFNKAKSNASVRKIQSNIEKLYGLPTGSVKLVYPGDREVAPNSTVEMLRDGWSWLVG